jgi:hypothetical protein
LGQGQSLEIQRKEMRGTMLNREKRKRERGRVRRHGKR